MKLFDHLNNILQDKKEIDWEDPEQTKEYDPYMLNRFLSICDAYIPIIEVTNIKNISKQTHFRVMSEFIPKRSQRLNFKNYISTKKDKVNDD